MVPHPLTNFETLKYYQNEPRFNGVQDGAYVINLDQYSDIGTHWVALYVLNNDDTYFHSFEVEDIPKGIKRFVGNKIIKTNIFRIQAYDSIVCGYFASDLLILCLQERL